MANILVNIEKGVEVGAADVLNFITGAEKKLTMAPVVLAAVGTVLGSVAAAVTSTEAASASGFVNIQLDITAFNNIKAVWPQIQAAAKDAGINL